jgi:aspartate dehydrogenase
MNEPTRVGLIGLGAIARSVLGHLPVGFVAGGVLVREQRAAEARDELPDAIEVVRTPDELLALDLAAVLECAGQAALARFGEAILEGGADLIAASTGALANDELRSRFAAAAARGGSRLIVPAGAIGGLDALGALRPGGLSRVAYTSIKPPIAWRGTPAERVVDLSSVRESVTVFQGSAREAAQLFPKNANVSVTVALAAGALEETLVTLVVDPGVSENIGVIEADGLLGSLRLELRGPGSADNPRTSAITALSLIQALERMRGVFVI